MSRHRWLPLALILAAACRSAAPADPATLDPVAIRYVQLVLALGQHDASYVDAYYGPDSLRQAAARDTVPLPAIRAAADSLLAALGDSTPAYADSLVRLRHAYLRTQLGALAARTRMLSGERLSFDEEARALYAAEPPHYDDAHFDSLVVRLDSLLPGRGELTARYERFAASVAIPAARVDTVFRTAIAACRARTLGRIPLPEGERFDLEYVTGTSWNAYNWYKGSYTSLIQVNLDFPIALDRAIDLACHEGYPGHHVYNAMLEKNLVRDRGWVEYSVYPLNSPQSLIAEGSANYGIEMAFPAQERVAYEKANLFPLAGIDPSRAEKYYRVEELVKKTSYAGNEAARRYLNGEINADQAVEWLTKFGLYSPERARQRVRFIDQYRSYVINYNLGKDLVRNYVERRSHGDAEARWDVFAELLSSPRLPSGLVR